MQNLLNKHVQLVIPNSQLNNSSGVLQLSEAGDDFIKLIPWDVAYQQSHKPWVGVAGEVHIRRQDIRGIIDIDTINGKAIEELSTSLEGTGTNPSKFADNIS